MEIERRRGEGEGERKTEKERDRERERDKEKVGVRTGVGRRGRDEEGKGGRDGDRQGGEGKGGAEGRRQSALPGLSACKPGPRRPGSRGGGRVASSGLRALARLLRSVRDERVGTPRRSSERYGSSVSFFAHGFSAAWVAR